MYRQGRAYQALWLRRLLGVLQHEQNGPTKIYYDSKPAIKLFKNPTLRGRSKHIDIKYHLMCEFVRDKEIEIGYCRTEKQVADIFTKALKIESFLEVEEDVRHVQV